MRLLMGLMRVLGGFILVVAVAGARERDAWSSVIPTILGLSCLFQPELFRWKLARAKLNTCLERTMTFEQEGFTDRCACGTDKRFWAAVKKIDHLRGMLLIYTGEAVYHFLPFDELPSEQRSELLRLLPADVTRPAGLMKAANA